VFTASILDGFSLFPVGQDQLTAIDSPWGIRHGAPIPSSSAKKSRFLRSSETYHEAVKLIILIVITLSA
jgi:hypothetical protein